MQEVENSSAEVVLKRFEELYNKYKYMEISLTQKKKRRVGSSTLGFTACICWDPVISG